MPSRMGENRIESPPEFIEAVKRGDVTKVRDLVRANPALLNSRTKRGLSPVLVAIYSGQKVAAANLIALGAELDVHDASAAGPMDRGRELLERGPSLVNALSVEGVAPMGLAAYPGHQGVVEDLLAECADAHL